MVRRSLANEGDVATPPCRHADLLAAPVGPLFDHLLLAFDELHIWIACSLEQAFRSHPSDGNIPPPHVNIHYGTCTTSRFHILRVSLDVAPKCSAISGPDVPIFSLTIDLVRLPIGCKYRSEAPFSVLYPKRRAPFLWLQALSSFFLTLEAFPPLCSPLISSI